MAAAMVVRRWSFYYSYREEFFKEFHRGRPNHFLNLAVRSQLDPVSRWSRRGVLSLMLVRSYPPEWVIAIELKSWLSLVLEVIIDQVSRKGERKFVFWGSLVKVRENSSWGSLDWVREKFVLGVVFRFLQLSSVCVFGFRGFLLRRRWSIVTVHDWYRFSSSSSVCVFGFVGFLLRRLLVFLLDGWWIVTFHDYGDDRSGCSRLTELFFCSYDESYFQLLLIYDQVLQYVCSFVCGTVDGWPKSVVRVAWS